MKNQSLSTGASTIMRRASLLMLPLTVAVMPLAAADDTSRSGSGVAVHGSIQSDILFPQTDAAIGAEDYREDVLTNTYADVSLISKYVDAGLRVEYMDYPLPGFEPDFKGWGVPNIYVKGRLKGFELTAGDFYEQFGNGFILRTYEERSLGIDNSIRGGRLKVNAVPGLRLTALGGVQRQYWDWSVNSQIYGADAEAELQRLIPKLAEKDISWTFGASWVLKYEKDQDIIVNRPQEGIPTEESLYRLNLPKTVNAMDIRTHFYRRGLDLQAEFALKAPDPSFDNNYTYRHGTALMLSGAYSRPGWSVMVQAKRSENMSFRSRRAQHGLAAFVNNMPPFAYQHTYALASMFPYATQAAPGEWAFQGAFAYSFKRGTAMGGRYGTKFKLNASYICGIDRDTPMTVPDNSQYGTDGGSRTKFFGFGQTYYWDFNLQMEKRLVRDVNLSLMYMNQRYNQTVLEGSGGNINANIFVAEAKWKISKLFTLRAELQYMLSDKKADYNPAEENETPTVTHESILNGWGDWCYGLLELSINPYVMLTVSDQWNHGGNDNHYYLFSATGNYKAHRLMVGYGRTRAGFNCSGGVCRWVPATRGFQVAYSFNF